MKTQKRCRFHRLDLLVAFDLDDTATLYVSESMARKIAAQMLAIADNIRDCPRFSESSVGSPVVEDTPECEAPELPAFEVCRQLVSWWEGFDDSDMEGNELVQALEPTVALAQEIITD